MLQMNRCVFLCLLALTGNLSVPTVSAQLNPEGNQQSTVDLSDVTDGFVRNMKLLETLTPEADIREQMAAVSAQAEELGKFFRAKGTASKRRKLFEEQEEYKYTKNPSKNDIRKLEEIRQDIKDLDPENFFGKGRELYGKTQDELKSQLDLIQTSDPVRQDIIRLIKQHLDKYNQALREY